jgi:hypothetical protein
MRISNNSGRGRDIGASIRDIDIGWENKVIDGNRAIGGDRAIDGDTAEKSEDGILGITVVVEEEAESFGLEMAVESSATPCAEK